ncbi:MAG: SDR family oxidoreductase [Actinomycetota bacterium]|nr:SDR family oxidoreductase [Actinomycetota bacterium]
MAPSFEGKSVLVTGGSRGIGRGIALRFAELGAARVAISYLRNDRAAEDTAAELRARGAEAATLRGNVGDPEKARRIVAEAGRLDVLVSNAATGVIRSVEELTERHWDWTLNANARALLTLARHSAPEMRAGSSIVAITSLGSERVLPHYALVGTSKAALEALVRYLAVELAPLGIRVNAVSAGLVETSALDFFPDRDEMIAEFRRRTPAGRLVDPRHVADAVCFLCSPEAEMIRGQAVVVDGGHSLLA